jgi:hypothetical protein
MFSKKLAALVATSLVVATAPAAAQSVSKLSPVSTARAGAIVGEANSMGNPDDRYGGGLWVALIGAALLAAFILIVLDEDEDDLPDSP